MKTAIHLINHKANSRGINLVLLMMFLSLCNSLYAQTLRYVDTTGSDSGNCDQPGNACATIGYTLNQANNGDTIIIASGIYTEQLQINKDITLKGAGNTLPGGTVIQAHAVKGQAGFRVITNTVSNQLTIEDLVIRNGVMGVGAGLYATNQSVVNLTRVSFIDNQSTSSGGGFFISSSGTAFLNNVLFLDNTGGYGGGMANKGTATLNQVVFDNNIATVSGGAFYSQGVSHLTDIQFLNNNAEYAGGALVADDTLNLNQVNFINNTTNQREGGAIMAANATANLQQVDFINNKAGVTNPSQDHGGALYIKQNSDFTIIDANFVDNESSDGFGGAIAAYDSELAIYSSNFQGNISKTQGGALFADNAIIQIDNCDFKSNQSYHAGAIMSESSNLDIINSAFTNNSATGQTAGALLAYNQSICTVKNSIFNNNNADSYAGAIGNVNSSMLINNTLVVGNVAAGSGSGIANSGNMQLSNLTISQNGDPNNAGVGGILNLSGNLDIVNSVIWDNYGSITDIGNGSGATLNISYSIYNQNTSYNEGVLNSQNCQSTDPGFEDSSNQDFQLSSNSIAIDAGDPNTDLNQFVTNQQNLPIDLAGNERIINQQIDIGAYEYNSLSTTDEHNALEIQVYPNPVVTDVNIFYNGPILSSQLYNLQGVKLKEWKNQKKLSLEGLPTGTFLLTIKTTIGDQSRIIVKL